MPQIPGLTYNFVILYFPYLTMRYFQQVVFIYGCINCYTTVPPSVFRRCPYADRWSFSCEAPSNIRLQNSYVDSFLMADGKSKPFFSQYSHAYGTQNTYSYAYSRTRELRCLGSYIDTICLQKTSYWRHSLGHHKCAY